MCCSLLFKDKVERQLWRSIFQKGCIVRDKWFVQDYGNERDARGCGLWNCGYCVLTCCCICSLCHLVGSVCSDDTSTYNIHGGLNCLIEDWNEEEISSDIQLGVKTDNHGSKKKRKKTFDKHCQTRLCVLKFYLLDHIVVDLEKSGGFEALTSSSLERYNAHIKSAYPGT